MSTPRTVSLLHNPGDQTCITLDCVGNVAHRKPRPMQRDHTFTARRNPHTIPLALQYPRPIPADVLDDLVCQYVSLERFFRTISGCKLQMFHFILPV